MEAIEKFIETHIISDYEVLTDTGWNDIEAIGKTVKYQIYHIKTEDFELECADKHIVFTVDHVEKYVEGLILGDFIYTSKGFQKITFLNIKDEFEHMYDLQLQEGNRRFYTNGILSHNSLWMQNLAANAADSGLNVVFISLEMSERKVLKRLGSMRLKIPVNEYDELSKDKELIQRKIADLKAGASTGNKLYSNDIGKIFVKEFPANSCTDHDIDQYCKNIQEKKGIKIGLIVIDYLTIMGLPKGSNIENNLYQRGKNLAEGVRALGYRYECPVITAMQVSKDAWSASDINLNSVPESKAIAETADTFWAIIRNPEMKRKNLYRLKVLKLRDGDFTYEQIMFDLNTKYLTVENDRFLEPSQTN